MNATKAGIKQLLDDGLAAYRRGEFGDAEKLVGEALEHGPRIAAAHDLMAKICLRREKFTKAEQHARRAVALVGGKAVFYDTLARAALGSGNAAATLADFEGATKAHPGDFGVTYGHGVLLMELGRNEDALEHLERARALKPDSRAAQMKTAALYRRTGRYEEAVALVDSLIADGADGAELHAIAARSLLAMELPERAAKSWEKALARNGNAWEYHTSLSTAWWKSGHLEEARAVTARFLERFPVHTREAENPEASVLVLSGLQDGCFTKPLSGIRTFIGANAIMQIPARRLTFRQLYMNHPDPVRASLAAGPVDLVFNNLANAETAGRSGFGEQVRKIVNALGVPVVNAPEAVARTTRRENAERIPAALDIVFPRTGRHTLAREGLAETAAEIRMGYSFPVIIRRAETHRDESVPLIDNASGISGVLETFLERGVDDVYVIEFRGETFRPGVYRRFRCALIDGVFYPALGDFSVNWNVHRLDAANAFMQTNPALMEEEHAFLRDPAGHIGAENIARLEALAGLMELEFLGVDFNITRAGELVVFEANPAMRMLFPQLFGDFPYLQEPHENISVAFEEMLLRIAHV